MSMPEFRFEKARMRRRMLPSDGDGPGRYDRGDRGHDRGRAFPFRKALSYYADLLGRHYWRFHAMNRMAGAPNTPAFCIADLRSSEVVQERAFPSSATSWRTIKSLGSSALRNTFPFVIPAD